MVGVPGKYRGCETCRGRRVKCGNERPICKKCADSKRDCTYERETVFIIASIEDGGRCSSHPPRKTAKKNKTPSKSVSPVEERLELVAEKPLTLAWNDLISVSNFGKQYTLQIASLHTHNLSVVRSSPDGDSDDGRNKTTSLSLTPYEIPDVQPSPSDVDFQVRSRCMVHLPSTDNKQAERASSGLSIDGVFLFLYEQNNSTSSGTVPPWKDFNTVRQQGPESFRLFPSHHYFARVYRPTAIGAALQNRKQTFLSEFPWVTAPWELHPKSHFDHLLDIISLLPSILQRADRIVGQGQTLARRLMIQDLLSNCISLESQFNNWLLTITASSSTSPSTPLFWPDPTTNSIIPFSDPFSFRDDLTAFSLIYYWMAQLLFCPCVERLYWTFFQPVVDGPFPQAVPILPPALENMNMLRYGRKAMRDMASNLCRSLDFTLAKTVQPDLLTVPLWVVWQFWASYVGGMDPGGGAGEEEMFGDGRLEGMWCEGFRVRLAGKGREMQGWVMERGWRDIGWF